MIEQWARRYGAGVPLRDGPAPRGRLHRARGDQRDPARAPGRLPPLARGRERRPARSASAAPSPPRATTGAPAPAGGHGAQHQPPAPLLRRSSASRPSGCTRGWSARSGEPCDLRRFMAYSVDVTSALAFGHDLNTLERGDGELQQHIERVFELCPPHPRAVPVLADTSSRRPTAPPSARSPRSAGRWTRSSRRPGRGWRGAPSSTASPRTSSRACSPLSARGATATRRCSATSSRCCSRGRTRRRTRCVWTAWSSPPRPAAAGGLLAERATRAQARDRTTPTASSTPTRAARDDRG